MLRTQGNASQVPGVGEAKVSAEGEHLGNFISCTGSFAPTVMSRRTKASGALARIQRKVLCNPHLVLAIRAACAMSMVVSVLPWGAETWPDPTLYLLRILEGFVSRLARIAMEVGGDEHVGTAPLRRRLGWVDMKCGLRRRRLVFLGALQGGAPGFLRALTHGHWHDAIDGSIPELLPWVATLRQDLSRLWDDVKNSGNSALPDPLVGPGPWAELMLKKDKWRDTVRPHQTYDFDHMANAEPMFSVPPGTDPADAVTCDFPGCGRVFVGRIRRSAPGTHKLQGHGIFSRANEIVHARWRPVCGFEATTPKGARDHFSNVCSEVPWVQRPDAVRPHKKQGKKKKASQPRKTSRCNDLA